MLGLRAYSSWEAEDLENLCSILKIHRGGRVGFSNSIRFLSTLPPSRFPILEVSVSVYMYLPEKFDTPGSFDGFDFCWVFFSSAKVMFSYSDF